MATAETLPIPNVGATSPTDRIDSIDVLRGVAVLGILTINIWIFGFPFEVGANPTLWGEFFGADLVAWYTGWIAFEGSQRAIFTMLFGASIVLFTSRLENDERRPLLTKIYYRRTLLLILFGLIDGYLLLWHGDILFFYGVAGLLLFFVRGWQPRRLFIVGVLILTVLSLVNLAGSWADSYYSPIAEVAEQKLERGESLTQEEIMAQDIVASLPLEEPTQEEISNSVEARKSGYLSAFGPNIEDTTEAFVIFGLYSLYWESLAMMMVGIALFKLGVFDASRSTTTYVLMLVIGWTIGLAINTWEMTESVANEYQATYTSWTYDIGRVAVALGDIGLVMLICKFGVLSWWRNCLAAVGRMALSNYVAQTLICNTIFIGFGLYGQLRFHELYYVVGAVWIALLIVSSWWLSRFRYGPLEWVWRRLTYGQPVAMKKGT